MVFNCFHWFFQSQKEMVKTNLTEVNQPHCLWTIHPELTMSGQGGNNVLCGTGQKAFSCLSPFPFFSYWVSIFSVRVSVSVWVLFSNWIDLANMVL